MELHTIGIDLGKTVFHLVGLNLRGEVVVRKKFSRTQPAALHRQRTRRVDWDGSLRGASPNARAPGAETADPTGHRTSSE